MRLHTFRFPRINLNSLNTQLLLWVTLPFATLFLAISLSEVQGHERAMQQIVQERADSIVQAVALLAETKIDHRKDLLTQLAAQPLLHTYVADDPTQMTPALDQVAAQFSNGIALFDDQARLVASRDPGSWMDGPQIADWVAGVLKSGQAQSVPTRVEESWYLLMVVPLPDHAGVLMALDTLDHLALSTLAQVVQLDPRVELSVTGQDTDVLVQAIQRPAAGVEVNWTKAVVARATIRTVGWQVILRESWTDMVPPILRFESTIFLVVSITVLASVLALFFGLRGIVAPLRKLYVAASRVGWGDFDAISAEVGGVKEIADLHLALVGMTSQIRQQQQELQSYIGVITAGQEEERKRMARELHDEIVQSLIALNQQAELIERQLQKDPASAAQRLRELRPLITETIAGVRRLIHDLRPLYLEDLGFVPALEMLVRQTTERHGLVGDFEVVETGGGTSRRLSPALEIGVYRMVQEALRNVVTHARAGWVHVELTFDPSTITLRIEDDGQGFTPPPHPFQLAQQGHYGLLGIRERAQLLGGKLDMESEPGKGATIIVSLPAPDIDALT